MVEHEAINRAKQPLPRRGMQHGFTKMEMKALVEPTRATFGHWECPMHDRIGLIILTGKTRQIKCPIGALA